MLNNKETSQVKDSKFYKIPFNKQSFNDIRIQGDTFKVNLNRSGKKLIATRIT